MFPFHRHCTQFGSVNCHVDAFACFSLPVQPFVMLHIIIVLRIFFPNILEGVSGRIGYSALKNTMSKRSLRLKLKSFFFFLSRETSFSMPAGEHNWFSGGIIHSFSLCVSLSFFFLQIPSILLVKSKGYFRELEFISLPNRGSLFRSKLVVSKYTDNSRTFLFIFPSSEDYRNRCLNVWLGGSSQWTGIQRYL